MITLPAARLMLQDPKDIPALFDEMAMMPAAAQDALSHLVFDALSLKDRSSSLMTLTRIIALRPDWVSTREEVGFRQTLLIRAVKKGCLTTVNFLLDAGANPHASDTRSMNALDYAARHDFKKPDVPELCDVLLDRGGFTQQQKDAAFYYAADSGNLTAVTALLAHGAGFTKITDKGTALGAACLASESDYRKVDIVRAMLATAAGKQVIDQGWDSREGYGAPIHCAAYSGNVGVLCVLVAAGARVNPPPHIAHINPSTPLMSAALATKLEAIEFLVKAGADAGLVCATGHNALHHLAHSDIYLTDGHLPESVQIKLVEVLVDAGADIFLEDGHGLTPQASALENEKPRMAAYLASIASNRALSSGTSDPVGHSPAIGPRPRL